MQLIDDRLLLSATDLINHLECAHLSHLDLEMVSGRASIEETREEAAELVARKGDEHEAAYLESLRAAGREVVVIESERGLDGLERGTERTREAMRGGAEIIYQAVLYDGERWRDYADFLERVPKPSALGGWSYEVADTKLARRVKPYFLLQLCFYSELLAAEQGTEPESRCTSCSARTRARASVSPTSPPTTAASRAGSSACSGRARTAPTPTRSSTASCATGRATATPSAKPTTT